MQFEAIYNKGTIQFVPTLRFKSERFRLVINVPDEELIYEPAPFQLSAQANAQAQAMLDKYAAILNAPVPNDEVLPELSAEHEERLEAFDLRAQMRQEQGRPV
ncbi:MAG: hypothetical protein KJ614_07340 [Gammaproteobacteria bacterium]|uniref:hypothetical protein n=1 Tax=Rhodoferax sp. TaxID=50421 RepID=UPI00185DEFD8|nr:hypothetical protein [Rhodoferax sp.]MBU3898730.1 hypothetical protein [Gammaproteobacteria bacterium]MBA3056435.1 hypothetical protein [Rhodoferax sp.]MBU3997234.1 hypothetical protein [Gammaproteobacteria bacterium]MBU4080799.1 hypothetical protein [Gammaproteobacteria bacterium]MBU4112444.1 hypothetical protein [Gammaproteobacteria bacterium]